jgi:hypothetical protein
MCRKLQRKLSPRAKTSPHTFSPHFIPHNTQECRNTPQYLLLTLHRRAIMLYTGISLRRSIARIFASLKNTPAVSRLPTSVDLSKFSSFRCRNTPTVYLKLLLKHYTFNRTNCVGHTTHTHCTVGGFESHWSYPKTVTVARPGDSYRLSRGHDAARWTKYFELNYLPRHKYQETGKGSPVSSGCLRMLVTRSDASPHLHSSTRMTTWDTSRALASTDTTNGYNTCQHTALGRRRTTPIIMQRCCSGHELRNTTLLTPLYTPTSPESDSTLSLPVTMIKWINKNLTAKMAGRIIRLNQHSSPIFTDKKHIMLVHNHEIKNEVTWLNNLQHCVRLSWRSEYKLLCNKLF